MECYSEKSSCFYQGRKTGKKNKEIKKHPRGRGPTRSQAKEGSESPQDRKAQSRRSRNFTKSAPDSSQMEKHLAEKSGRITGGAVEPPVSWSH